VKANEEKNPEATKKRLLDAAEEIFSERGYAAATVREITARGACNVAAVNYHYGGKEALYREVFQRRLRALRDLRIRRIREYMEAPGAEPGLEGLLKAFVDAFLEPLMDRSRGTLFFRLMTQEILDPQLPEGMVFQEMIGPIQATMGGALQRVAPALSGEAVRRCMFSVVGQLLHVTFYLRLLAKTEGQAGSREEVRAVLDHIVRFSLGGMLATMEETS